MSCSWSSSIGIKPNPGLMVQPPRMTPLPRCLLLGSLGLVVSWVWPHHVPKNRCRSSAEHPSHGFVKSDLCLLHGQSVRGRQIAEISRTIRLLASGHQVGLIAIIGSSQISRSVSVVLFRRLLQRPPVFPGRSTFNKRGSRASSFRMSFWNFSWKHVRR